MIEFAKRLGLAFMVLTVLFGTLFQWFYELPQKEVYIWGLLTTITFVLLSVYFYWFKDR